MAGALDGIRILDLSWGIAGPLGVLLLAEQGADVIKVEPPGGDPFRAYDGYRVWNRSRRSLTVDLKSDRGKDVFDRLLGTADVVVESFRPGVMDRLGFGYDDVHSRHPRVIFLSCPAYPPGIHQQMVFECADGWVHASVMSGLTPKKSQDEILGLDDAPDPFTFMAMPPEEREKINQKRRDKFKEWKRDDVVAAFQENN